MLAVQAAPMGSQSRDSDRMEAHAVDAARANTYRLLARLLAAPASSDLLGMFKHIDATGSVGSNGVMAVAWQTLKLAGERTTVEAVDDEFHDLFIGLSRGELVPYGSWYLTGLLMDQPLAVLRRDLAALGFERREGIHEPEDHVSALCETMSLIIDSSDGTSFDVQRDFFHAHMAPWFSRFFGDLQKSKSARFYCAVGHLGEQFIQIERQYLAL